MCRGVGTSTMYSWQWCASLVVLTLTYTTQTNVRYSTAYVTIRARTYITLPLTMYTVCSRRVLRPRWTDALRLDISTVQYHYKKASVLWIKFNFLLYSSLNRIAAPQQSLARIFLSRISSAVSLPSNQHLSRSAHTNYIRSQYLRLSNTIFLLSN